MSRIDNGEGNTITSNVVISHNVKKFVREKVGIPEGEPVALMVHITKGDLGYDIYNHGFVNVSGRGTLAPITDLDDPDINVGVPSILALSGANRRENMVKIIFCLPARYLRGDVTGVYGYWFDNPLTRGSDPVLDRVYDGIAIEYDSQTGKPIKFAKDDPHLYPVHIPQKYIYDVIYPSQYTGTKAGD